MRVKEREDNDKLCLRAHTQHKTGHYVASIQMCDSLFNLYIIARCSHSPYLIFTSVLYIKINRIVLKIPRLATSSGSPNLENSKGFKDI